MKNTFVKFIYQDSLLRNQILANSAENLQMKTTNFQPLPAVLQENTDMVTWHNLFSFMEST